MKQTSFLKPPRLEHGGTIRAGKRKLARPLDPKRSLHLVLRATRAKGHWSLLHPKNCKQVERVTKRLANKFQIRIYQYANSGNHLHLLVRGKNRKDLQDFFRAIGAVIACLVTGAKKGKKIGKFWDLLLYSKVISWGREFIAAKAYVLRNELESRQIIPYRPRKRKPPPTMLQFR